MPGPRYVGVLGITAEEHVAKRAALLCDTLLCADDTHLHEAIELGIIRPHLFEERDKAFNALPADVSNEEATRFEQEAARIRNTLPEMATATARLEELQSAVHPDDEPSPALLTAVTELLASSYAFIDGIARIHAQLFRIAYPNEVFIPILHGVGRSSTTANRATVLSIVLEQLPLPDAETPWGAIADWRNDEAAREKYLRIRSWINRIARDGLPEPDLYEAILADLATYERYMSIQHKKINRGRMEAIILTIAEAVEDIAHLRLSSAAHRLFGIYKTEIQLLESEMTAPGRELAYVADARHRFGPAA